MSQSSSGIARPHRAATFAAVGLFVFVYAGCDSRDVAQRDAARAQRAGGLTATEVQRWRNANMLSPLTPVWITGTPSLPDAQAYGINTSGSVVGFFAAQGGPPWVQGQAATSFLHDGSGTVSLAVAGSAPRSFAVSINDAGYIAAMGGPTAGDWYNPILFHPDTTHTPEALPVGDDGDATIVGSSHSGSDSDQIVGGSIKRTGGPVMHWRFEGTGTGAGNDFGADDLGNAHLLSQTGQPPQVVVGHEGERAVHFNGSTEGAYAAVTTASDPTDKPGVTIMAWVKPAVCPPSPSPSPVPLVQRGRQFALGLRCHTDGSIGLSGFVNSTGTLMTIADSTTDFGSMISGTWSHVAMVWDRHVVRYYVNGEPVGSTAATDQVSGVASWMLIGYDSTFYAGDLDDASLFMEPLAGPQIRQYFLGNGNYRPYVDRYHWYRYQVGDGSQAPLTVIPAPRGDEFNGGGFLYGMNDGGDAVGYHELAAGGRVATVYTDADGTQLLNDLHMLGDGWDLQFASAISNSRQIVGYGTREGHRAGFVLDLDTHEITEVTSPNTAFEDPNQWIVPRAINAHGDVVGTFFGSSGWPEKAFLFSVATGLTDLNDLIDVGQGWRLRDARAINDSDQIVGYATDAADPVATKRAFRLSLPTLPSSIVAECAGQDDGTPCNDYDQCTQTDTCHGGVCQGENPVLCAPPDQCHAPGECVPATGACTNPPIGGFVCTSGFPIAFHLPDPGNVSIGIFKVDTGEQVRELAHAVPKEAGEHVMVWDGLKDDGTGAVAGEYEWRLLGTPAIGSTPAGLSVQFLYKVGDNYPIGSSFFTSAGLGNHRSPSAIAVNGADVYLGAESAEGFSAMINMRFDDQDQIWRRNWDRDGVSGFVGGRSLATYNGELFALGWHTGPQAQAQSVFVLNPADSSTATRNGVPVAPIPVENDGSSFDASDMDVGPSAVAGDAGQSGEIVVAYNHARLLRWYRVSDQALLAELDDVAWPGGVAVASDGTVFVSTGSGVSTVKRGQTPFALTQVITGLGRPDRLDVDPTTGDVIVYDAGTMQVKRFASPQPTSASCRANPTVAPAPGELCKTYGRSGGRESGLYNPRNFDGVTDLKSDGNGGFWIAEAFSAPRRVAHFPAGAEAPDLEWYGNQPWYTQAEFDPDDPYVMWLGSVETLKDADPRYMPHLAVPATYYAPPMDTRYIMRVIVDPVSKTWSVHSTYRYVVPDAPRMYDSALLGGAFHVYRSGPDNFKYLVTDAPSVHRIDESEWRLRRMTTIFGDQATGFERWTDANDNEQIDAGETTAVTYPGTPSLYFGRSIDANLDVFITEYLPGQDPRCTIYRQKVTWEGGLPHYQDAQPYAACPQSAIAGSGDDSGRYVFLHHDAATGDLYAGFNLGILDLYFFTDSFIHKWNAPVGSSLATSAWDAGEVAPPYFDGIPPVAPGQIRSSLRGFAGVVNDSVIAVDGAGGWKDEPYPYTYVWTRDGLYVGGIMDHPDLNGIDKFMYSASGDLYRTAAITLADGSVLLALAAEGDWRVYRVTGWNDWFHPDPVRFTVPGPPSSNVGTGLTATYFDASDFSQPKTTRVDGPVDFDWGSRIPAGTALTAANDYSVRWSGSVQPTYGPRFTGYWRRRTDGGQDTSGGVYRDAPETGAAVEVKFHGTYIRVMGYKGPDAPTPTRNYYYGKANVTVDGVAQGQKSWSGAPEAYGEIFRIESLSPGDHILKIQTSPTLSGGLPGWINVDDFVTPDGTIDEDGIEYQFFLNANVPAHLTVRGEQIVDDPSSIAPTIERGGGAVKLRREDNPIELSIVKRAGDAKVRLEWKSPFAFDSKQVVPAAALFP